MNNRTNSSPYRSAIVSGICLLQALLAQDKAINAIPAGTSLDDEQAAIEAAGRSVRQIAKKLAAVDPDGEATVEGVRDLAARLAA